MTLLEHLEERGEKRGEKRGEHFGKISTLIRQLSTGFAEFSPADADRVRELPDEALDELTDAIAMRRTWAQIEPILRQT
jgi:hypothetical protein